MSLVREALLAARAYVEPMGTPQQAYGFPGGDYDPRRFKPDEESNTAEELAAHKAACEAWDRGERPTVARSGRVEHTILPAGPDGAGGTTVSIEHLDRDAADVLAKIDRALEVLA